MPGTSAKFSSLLPWSVLNSILEEHRLEPPRLRLTREGQPVPAERFLSFSANRRKSGQPIPRLNAAALSSELREGATLVLDAVDELHRPIRNLAESLERIFRVRSQVNAYAGWRTSHGFDLHWDDHDVFVLQVAGRKRWQIYGTTRKFPLKLDVTPANKPPSQVLWDGLLQQGDLLYIPRGWWHVAMPLDEPTLHLTVGVNNLTGVDLLTWFTSRLRSEEDVRRDIPLFGGAEAKQAFAECLRDALLSHWNPGVIEEFLADADAKSSSRPVLGLPFTAMPQVLPEDDLWFVQWRGTRDVKIETDSDGNLVVVALGRRWRFSQDAKPMLTMFTSGRKCSLADLQRSAGDLSSTRIRAFVRELIIAGLLNLS